MSVSVVARPRNQRYLHPRFLGTGVAVCEVEEGCKLAIKLHSKLSILRHQPDLFNELPDAFRGLEAGVFIIQGFGEIGDLLAVELGKRARRTACAQRSKIRSMQTCWCSSKPKQPSKALGGVSDLASCRCRKFANQIANQLRDTGRHRTPQGYHAYGV